METTFTECPNCHNSLKSGLFSSVSLLDPYKTKVINSVDNKELAGYCTKCGDSLYSNASIRLQQETDEVKKQLTEAFTYVPVVSTQNPLNWDYRVLTMVTAQSTTGTGVFSELSAGFADLLGSQSGAYNRKIKLGEQLCFAQLRKQTLDLGGNAVIATDIDYSEVGGDKGMLMVCMAGTAVILHNVEVLGEIRVVKLKEISRLDTKLKTLLEIAKPVN